MGIIYKQCPRCGSKNSIRIVYGYPSHELFNEAEAGKVKLGGCCIFESSPEYFCKECEHEWNREQAIDAAYNKITTIKASVGGFFGGYYNVEIDLVNLKTLWSQWGGGTEEDSINKTIRQSTANKFVGQLKMVDLLNWKAKYIEREVCDGTQWSVEIMADGRTIKKQGDNKFPKEWDMFCKIIREITNKKFK